MDNERYYNIQVVTEINIFASLARKLKLYSFDFSESTYNMARHYQELIGLVDKEDVISARRIR